MRVRGYVAAGWRDVEYVAQHRLLPPGLPVVLALADPAADQLEGSIDAAGEHAGRTPEDLEYAALMAAARLSATRLSPDPGQPRRRVVFALDLDPATEVESGPDHDAPYRLRTGVPTHRLSALHLDPPEGFTDPESDLGWYGVQELEYVVGH